MESPVISLPLSADWTSDDIEEGGKCQDPTLVGVSCCVQKIVPVGYEETVDGPSFIGVVVRFILLIITICYGNTRDDRKIQR